jgi:hypothetical protein
MASTFASTEAFNASENICRATSTHLGAHSSLQDTFSHCRSFLAHCDGTTTFTPQLPQIFRSQHGHVVSLKPVLVSPQRSQTFEDTLSTAAAPAWVAARAAMDPDRMADRPIAPSISILTCA